MLIACYSCAAPFQSLPNKIQDQKLKTCILEKPNNGSLLGFFKLANATCYQTITRNLRYDAVCSSDKQQRKNRPFKEPMNGFRSRFTTSRCATLVTRPLVGSVGGELVGGTECCVLSAILLIRREK